MAAEEDVTLRMHEMRARLDRLNALLRSSEVNENRGTAPGGMHNVQTSSDAVPPPVSASEPHPQLSPYEQVNGGGGDTTTTHVALPPAFAGALLHDQPVQAFHAVQQRLRQKLRQLDQSKVSQTGATAAEVATEATDTARPVGANASGNVASLTSSPSNQSPPPTRRGHSAETATPPRPATPPRAPTLQASAAVAVEVQSTSGDGILHLPHDANADVVSLPPFMPLRQTGITRAADAHPMQGVPVPSYRRPTLSAQARVVPELAAASSAHGPASRAATTAQRALVTGRLAAGRRVGGRVATVMSSSRDSRRSARNNAAPVPFAAQATVLESLTTAELLAVLRMRRVIVSSGTVPAMLGDSFAALGYRHAIYLTPLEHAQLLLLRSALHAVKASHARRTPQQAAMRPASARRPAVPPSPSHRDSTTRHASRRPSSYA